MAKLRFEGEWKLWVTLGVLAASVVGYLYFVSRPPMEGGEYLWNVVKAVNGREVTLRGSGNLVQFRLIGLTVPPSQEKAAQEFLAKSLQDQWIRMKALRDAPQGVKEGLMYLSGEDMVARLIRQGLAQTDRSETAFDVRPYMELEQEAKKQKRGMWSHSEQGAN
jgi:micrococcal nuclease